MKIKYFIVFTFLSVGFVNAYELEKNVQVLQYSKKSEYKKYINLANRFSLEKNIKSSLEYAQKAAKLEPKNKEPLLIMARIYNYKKDYAKLRETAEKILKISPNNYLGKIYLANSFLDKDRAKAKKILTDLLKKYPEDERIKEKLKLI